MDFTDYFAANGWTLAHDAETPAVPPVYTTADDLPLSVLSRRVLVHYPQGIYQHQHKAIELSLDDRNVCMTTATASGKSLVFYISGLEQLCRRPNGTVLAVYPLKALTDEQEMKWREAIAQTGTEIKIGRIDGSVPQSQRKKLIADASILIMTPDVVHAWLLSNLQDRGVVNFLANLQLIIIDEAHTYSGVFGSNAAYLFRRIHHLAAKMGAAPRYIAASATINSPRHHLQQLTGEPFDLVDREEDTAGHKARRLLVAEPPEAGDVLTALTSLMHFVTRDTKHQFITFVDSRKQTEQLASVMRRGLETETESDELDFDILERLHVYPFRAGYEAADRKRIQTRLRRGEVRGVISTSALEMGIDIPGLTLGILFGLPNSATSYYQRIGRIGRHADGTIIVVGNGSVVSNRVVRNPELLANMPLAEGALYLENPRVQYIHAMCLARPDGEDAVIANGKATPQDGLEPYASFPEPFLALCAQEQVGEVGPEFQAMKLEAGTNPNYAFPLRDSEVQYRVETTERSGPTRQLGSLSFSQVMREAYPGAVYYYQTQPFRIVRVLFRQHTILARPERHYWTRPTTIPPLIFPNLAMGNVYAAQRYGELSVAECNLQLKESIIGFKERRGPNEFSVSYPLDANLGFYFDQPRFERNYFSSGVLLAHPALERDGVQRDLLATILYEAFLLQIPFERQDLSYGSDRFRVSRGAFGEGQRFLCIYDQTYGSLRLTSRLMEPAVLSGVFDKALEIVLHDSTFDPDDATLAALRALHEAVDAQPVTEALDDELDLPPADCVQIIGPGSVGLYPDYHNEEFLIEAVVYTPRGLVYRGKRLSQKGVRFEEVTVTAPVDRIVPIAGRSQLVWYNYDTGEILGQDRARKPAAAMP